MAKRQATTRIIAGKYRGTKLTFKPNKSLRPTESKTKETLFNWLFNDLDNKNCLDMFAGTGSLGFEALSRGAKEVIFIEKQKSLCNSIEDVAKQLGIKKKCRIINANSTSINFNNLNAKDPVAMGLFTQKDLIEALEKAERRIKREKKEKEKQNKSTQATV